MIVAAYPMCTLNIIPKDALGMILNGDRLCSPFLRVHV
jgi:hypothetical protein